MTLNSAQLEKELLEEISIITGTPTEQLTPEASLLSNGINSMGFIELVLSVNRKWGVNLMEKGVVSSDVKSIQALAERIIKEQLL